MVQTAGKPLVAKAITLTPGAPVDPRALGETRRRLYDTGLYRSVAIDLQPLNPAAATTPSTPDLQAEGDRPVAARIQLEGRPGYSLRYGLAFNDDVVGPDMREQRLGFAADLAKRNLFSPGTTAGLSARLRRDFQVGRFYLGAERFFTLPLRSTVFVSRSREQPDSGEALAFVTDVTEIFGEQSYRLRRLVELRYGYGFGQNRTTIESEDFDVKFKVARLTSSALIDRRQNPFDPRGGWFSAAGFELSRPGLGSDISFLKGFLQYYQFVPIGPHILVASAARVGLARTFEGQELVPSERFFAGGATTVRGYREDDLGPRSVIGDNEAGGGRAMLILNAELRLPIYRWVRGVGFVDVGNVYPGRGRHLVQGSPDWCWRGAAFRHTGRHHPARSGRSCQPACLRSEVEGVLRARARFLTRRTLPTPHGLHDRLDGRALGRIRRQLEEVLEVDGHLVDALGFVEAHAGLIVRVRHLWRAFCRLGERFGGLSILTLRIERLTQLKLRLRQFGIPLHRSASRVDRLVQVAVDERDAGFAHGPPGIPGLCKLAERVLCLIVLIELSMGESLEIPGLRGALARGSLDDLLDTCRLRRVSGPRPVPRQAVSER